MNDEQILRQLLQPETLVPSQYLDRVVAEPTIQPEKRLMLAVLESAVATYQKHVLATSRRGRRLFAESEAWVTVAADGWVFSFENICTALRLDAEFVRLGLYRWRDHARARGGTVRVPCRSPFRRVNGRRHRVSSKPRGSRNVEGRVDSEGVARYRACARLPSTPGTGPWTGR
jgi:hypothetical protein